LEYQISLEFHFLYSHLDIFLGTLGAVSDEEVGVLHQDGTALSGIAESSHDG
jgi:hypothetical protein